MSPTTNRVALSELISIKHGFAFRGEDITTVKHPYFLVTPGNFQVGGGFKLGKLKYFSGEVPAAYVLREGDLVVTMTDLSKNIDTLGFAATIPRLPSGLTALHNQRIGLIEIKSQHLDRRWLEYRLRAADYRAEVIASSTGTTVHHTSPGRILAFELELPPPEEQRAIAATLGALDDKIESNRRLIQLIPSLIRAKVIAASQPGSRSVPVSELASFVNGGAFTRGASGSGRMVIRIAELNSGPGGSTVYNDIEVPDEKTARAGDILMSWSGSLGVYRWFRDEAVINQHIFKVIPADFPAWLVFDRLDAIMPVFRGLAADKATTMGHIQRGHLTSVEVDVPDQSALDNLSAEVAPLWERLLLAEREVLSLESLRNTLLPELLSGRLSAALETRE
ncbi:restriction endonuclease subunit S [Glutamicibacter creatinolyticus]|uniref:restriction endonuclease subunit S n=1 Tax=Glutamicibacter creatinolyticus TaxID=162496 RepID=UPI0033E59530